MLFRTKTSTGYYPCKHLIFYYIVQVPEDYSNKIDTYLSRKFTLQQTRVDLCPILTLKGIEGEFGPFGFFPRSLVGGKVVDHHTLTTNRQPFQWKRFENPHINEGSNIDGPNETSDRFKEIDGADILNGGYPTTQFVFPLI